MYVGKYKSANEMFISLLPKVYEGDVIKSADDKKAKGEDYKKEIVEMRQVLYSIENSMECLTSIRSIAQSPFWAISELVSEVLNLNPPIMDRYNPQLMESSYKLGPSRAPIYSYGSRWFEHDTMMRIFKKLNKNPTSKRCFMPIFAGYDLDVTRSDIPCTLGHMFQVRDNKLDVNGIYRSKDCFAGLRYDILLAQFLQWTMTAWLNDAGHNLEPGRLSFFEESLHIYPHKNQGKYDEYLVQSMQCQEKIYVNDLERVALNWNPARYYKDLREVVEVERRTFARKSQPIVPELMLDKIEYPLFKDFAVMYMLKNKNIDIDYAQHLVHHDYIKNWYKLFYKNGE